MYSTSLQAAIACKKTKLMDRTVPCTVHVHYFAKFIQCIFQYMYEIIKETSCAYRTCSVYSVTFPALQCTSAMLALSSLSQVSISSQKGLINSNGGAL